MIPWSQAIRALCFAALGLFGNLSPAWSIDPPQAGEAVVACSPDRLTARNDEAVALRAWYAEPDHHGSSYSYSWSVSSGSVQGAAEKATWTFAPDSDGPAEARVTVFFGDRQIGECTLEVTVLKADRHLMRDPVRTVLLPDDVEADGYGLYSYLLFGAEPGDDEQSARYLAAIGEYWRLIPDLQGFMAERPISDLNAIHVPLRKPALPAASPEWVLAQYDYDRSRRLLNAVEGWHTSGPYLVSYRSKLTRSQRLSADEILFQDLTGTPPELLVLWLREFVFQAAQNDYRKTRTLPRLALELRTTIGQLAKVYPYMTKEAKSWISMIRPSAK